MTRSRSWVLVLMVALGLAAWAGEAQRAKAPPFTLEDQEGKKVSLSDFAGKIVVLEWVNKDCPFSRRHLRAGTLKAIAEKYKDKGVVCLAINSTKYHSRETNKKTVEEYKLPYPILDDHPGDIGHAYGAKTTPDIRIIGKQGALLYQGAIDNDPRGRRKEGKVNYVEKALGELLAGKQVSTPKTNPYGCSVKYAK